MIRDYDTKLKTMLDFKRYEHSLGVQKTAVEIAQRHGADIEKASIAGILHDCAKGFSDEKLLKSAELAGIEVNDVERRSPQLLHGPVGAYIAQVEFGVEDADILHAIRYHTTGCENMSLLDKIIYVADYIEPCRNFPGVDELRKTTFGNLDKGVIMALDNTLKYVIERGQLIHILTVKARNFMLSELPILMEERGLK